MKISALIFSAVFAHHNMLGWNCDLKYYSELIQYSICMIQILVLNVNIASKTELLTEFMVQHVFSEVQQEKMHLFY